jgi:hypothetical protein
MHHIAVLLGFMRFYLFLDDDVLVFVAEAEFVPGFQIKRASEVGGDIYASFVV